MKYIRHDLIKIKMNRRIFATATLLALTIIGRAVFRTDVGNAVANTTPVTTLPLAKLEKNTLNEVGGEFCLKLTLHRQGSSWTVVKTAQLTAAELHQPEYLKTFKTGFSEPDSNQLTTLTSPVREYLYYRKQAILNQDVSKLWLRYPELKQNIALNPHAETLTTKYQSVKPVDSNIDPEKYERLKVKVTGDVAEAIIHGTESYLYQPSN